MGMAASQARYLALTARKTNTEYEGQQINQARTALANQSANLFNRLLDLKVPNPPKTTDYTKVQYSYSDGENDSVIDHWEQLSSVNPDYNYLVTSHYYANLYTGSLKKLNDPQIQISGKGTKIDPWSTISYKKSIVDADDLAQQMSYKSYENVKSSEDVEILNIQTQAMVNDATYRMNDNAINYYKDITPAGAEYNTYELQNTNAGNVYTIKHFANPSGMTVADSDADEILNTLKNMIDTDIMNIDLVNSYLSSDIIEKSSDLTANTFPNYNASQIAALKAFALSTDSNGVKNLVAYNDIAQLPSDDDGTGTGKLNHDHLVTGTYIDGGAGVKLDDYVNGTNGIAVHQARIDTALNAYNTAKAKYDASLKDYNDNVVKPTFIGNSELTPLLSLTDDQKTELLQVVKDMKADNVNTDILNCFDSSNNYLGGIYSFKMNGTTYYTTQKNLEDTYPATQSNNYIDGQVKLPYYNASYIDKRVEQKSYALLETDGNGRFKSVKFDNDSVVYSLNTETVTDEAAYQDAMNRYTYEKEKYEKTIADINARTSIIQKEDRTLELRLRQLDTEQNALKTEMDAVKKVIKDNIDSTFKTFND